MHATLGTAAFKPRLLFPPARGGCSRLTDVLELELMELPLAALRFGVEALGDVALAR